MSLTSVGDAAITRTSHRARPLRGNRNVSALSY